MNKFEVRRMTSNGNWSINDGSGIYLHADGRSYYRCGEYWPTKEQAQAVLDKLNSKGTEMKKGDRVRIKDFSYARCVVGLSLHVYSPTFDDDARGEFVVIEVGCKFPKVSSTQGSVFGSSYNNTVLQSVQSGQVVFIEERFLVPAQHTIVIDGKEITISHESYRALKDNL
jgi:hypothetical protein